MSLATLVAEDNWQGFDDAWKALVEAGGAIDDLLVALDLVSQKRRMPRCLPMLREHAAALSALERAEEAAMLVGRALSGGGSPGELGDPLFKYAEEAWGQEEWWQPYLELSGFHADAPDVRRAWANFADLRSYRAGLILFHPAGWGVGEVTDLDATALEIGVRFHNGRQDRFPMRTAVEIFEVLPETDLRVQSFRDPEGLKKKLKAEPLETLKSILFRYNGRANTVALRNAMMQVGITGNAWTSWWRKTRLLAENSEWFRVTGNANRAEVQLLARAVDPVEALRKQLKHSTSLGEALSRVRDVLTGGQLEETLRLTALESLEALVGVEGSTEDERVATWVLLREQRGDTPAELVELMKVAADEPLPTDPSTPPRLWEIVGVLTTARDQERSLALLEEVLGTDRCVDELARHLPHAQAGLVKPAIEKLSGAERFEALEEHYGSLLARPLRAPFVLIGLARVLEKRGIPKSLPAPVQRAQALLELAVYLEDRRRGNPQFVRANTMLVQLLVRDDPPLLRVLLEDAEPETLKGLRMMMQRGADDAIDGLITDIAIERGSDASLSDKPFWESDEIWTTRSGIKRREAELRELREVKIPENREAIARAASYGDLSENAEWENAIREQSELTSLAATIEGELRLVALLENAPIPEDTVCPGTSVRYRETSGGGERHLVLLGPWDTYQEDTVYYRAPLAAGMLGRSRGERIEIELPSGTTEVEILGIEPAPID